MSSGSPLLEPVSSSSAYDHVKAVISSSSSKQSSSSSSSFSQSSNENEKWSLPNRNPREFEHYYKRASPSCPWLWQFFCDGFCESQKSTFRCTAAHSVAEFCIAMNIIPQKKDEENEVFEKRFGEWVVENWKNTDQKCKVTGHKHPHALCPFVHHEKEKKEFDQVRSLNKFHSELCPRIKDKKHCGVSLFCNFSYLDFSYLYFFCYSSGSPVGVTIPNRNMK